MPNKFMFIMANVIRLTTTRNASSFNAQIMINPVTTYYVTMTCYDTRSKD